MNEKNDTNITRTQIENQIKSQGSNSMFIGSMNFAQVDLSNLDMTGAKFSGTSFQGANLTNTNFSEAEFSHVKFSETNLSGAKFCKAKITSSTFINTVMENTNFSNASIITEIQMGGDPPERKYYSCFNQSNLNHSIFCDTHFYRVNFNNNSAKESDFTGARLIYVDLSGTNFSQTTFRGTVISELVMYDNTTTFDSDFNPVLAGMHYIDRKAITNDTIAGIIIIVVLIMCISLFFAIR